MREPTPASWADRATSGSFRGARQASSSPASNAPFLKGGIHKRVAESLTGEGEENVPKLLHARDPEDAEEEQKVRKLAGSRHAPGDWIFRARIISLSWQGLRTARIAEELGCHPKTVRKRLHRFNTDGMDGLGDRPGAGRKPRLTELERSRIITLPRTEPPGRLVRGGGGELEAFDEKRESHWTLDALTTAARDRSIVVAALRSGASSCEKESAGETPGRGRRVRTPSSPQKSQGRRSLHRPAT